jgi:hypothetical protein
MTTPAPLLDLELLTTAGQPTRLRDHVGGARLLVVFLRHFG